MNSIGRLAPLFGTIGKTGREVSNDRQIKISGTVILPEKGTTPNYDFRAETAQLGSNSINPKKFLAI